MSEHELIDLLRRNSLFTGLEPQYLADLARRMGTQEFQAGQTVFRRGDPGDCLFVIRHGRVQIEVPTANGPPVVLSVLEAGEFFGELALIDGKPRSASVVAIERTSTLALHHDDFQEFLRISPRAAGVILAVVGERLRQVGERQQELVLGHRIQIRLLGPPRLSLEGYELLSRSQPAAEVGGDFYNLFEVGGGGPLASLPRRLGVVLGDVAGKGVPAALFMAVTTTLIEAQAQLLLSPAETLAAANTVLYPKMRKVSGAQPLFVTAVYGVLDPAGGEMRLANAGQTPPIYWPAGSEPRYLRLKGLPLGALAASTYDETVLHLAPGDRLLFCSDGFIEERKPDGELLGYQGFRQRVMDLGERSGPELIAALFQTDNASSSDLDETIAPDDRTLVLITATAPAGVPS